MANEREELPRNNSMADEREDLLCPITKVMFRPARPHTDGRTDGRTRARTDGRTDARTHARTHVRMHARTHAHASGILWYPSPVTRTSALPCCNTGSRAQAMCRRDDNTWTQTLIPSWLRAHSSQTGTNAARSPHGWIKIPTVSPMAGSRASCRRCSPPRPRSLHRPPVRPTPADGRPPWQAAPPDSWA